MYQRCINGISLLIALVAVNLTANQAVAQGLTGAAGAEAWMTGGTSVTNINAWSGMNNPATLAFQNSHQIGLYAEQRFMMNEQRVANISGNFNTRWITIGAHIHQFGYELFNQQRLGITFGRVLTEQFGLGAGVEYVITNISEYGNEGAAVATLGAYYKATEKLSLGVYVFNPTRSKYALALSDPIPTLARAGAQYQLAKRIKLTIEAEQQLNYAAVWRGGIRYRLNDVLELAVGGASNPAYFTSGCRLQLRKLKFDLAASFHEVLGFTPHLGLSYPFGSAAQ